MRYLKNRKIAAVTTGIALCLAMEPISALAGNTPGDSPILQLAGVTLVLENQLSTEEYIEIAQQAQGASWGYTNIGIADVESGNLNVRAQASMNGRLVGKMPKDSACEVLEVVDGWAHISSGEVEGYVSLDYLLTGPDAILKAGEVAEKVVTVNVNGLNVRERPDTDSVILTQVLENEELDYVETLDGWIKVSVDEEEAYVASEYVTVEEKLSTAITMTELLYGAGVSDVRVELVEYAKQFLGNPYKWGGTSLTKGADCSGFVLSVFKKFGVKLPHYSGSQAKSGTKITASQLQPGDLIFYGSKNGVIGHVAIYIGNGQVIHASNPKSGIKISKYNYRTPLKYVRVLQD